MVLIVKKQYNPDSNPEEGLIFQMDDKQYLCQENNIYVTKCTKKPQLNYMTTPTNNLRAKAVHI